MGKAAKLISLKKFSMYKVHTHVQFYSFENLVEIEHNIRFFRVDRGL